MNYWKECIGEFIGTAILVFIGCGSVAVAVLYYPLELWQIALTWSIGVALAIYATKSYSSSHLNPAVTLAMVLAKNTNWKKLPAYFSSQLLGATLASLLLFLIINSDLVAFESLKGIVRGEAHSYRSAVMFGEFFPNPGFEKIVQVTHIQACLAEALGTFVLVFVIFLLTHEPRKLHKITPLFIGLTVGGIIMFVAPYTQAGLNPARDFGPRLVAYFGGWSNEAFPPIYGSFFTVYVLSPLAGGALAYYCQRLIYKR
jgi:glycerol uptake facilitator protein